jgi:DNA primase
MADNLVFCFDGDKAGRKAAWRALEQSLPVVVDGKDVRFLFLPPEDDPDTFVRRLGKHAFLAELKNAKPLSAFLFDELSAQVDLSAEEGRSRLLTYAKPLLSQITAPAMAMMLQRKLADLVGLGVVEIQRLIPIAGVAGATGQAPRDGQGAPWQGGSPGERPSGEQRFFRKRSQGREPGAPSPRHKSSPGGLPEQIIARMLLKPRMAGRFDIAVADDDASPIGAACRVAAFIRDHDFEVTQAQVIEHFRDSIDEAELARASLHPLLTDIDAARPDFDLDIEFDEALARLREAAVKLEKSREERRRAQEMGLS